MGHRALHVEAAEALAAVAQFQRFARALAGAGRHDGAARRAVAQVNLGLDRGAAAAVPDAAGMDRSDFTRLSHRSSSSCQAARTSASCDTGRSSNVRAVRRTASRCASDVTYSTGDLPSTRASNSPGSNAAARCSTAARGSQSTRSR